MKKYSRFQFGWLVVIVFLIVIVWITVAYRFQWGNNPIPKPGYIVLLLLFFGTFLFFYGMTVSVDEKQIIIKLGIGFYRRKIDLSLIKSVESITYPSYYGYGIRLIRNGILYNVSGNHAVRLTFKNSKRVILIGTNDWDNLKAVIEEKIKRIAYLPTLDGSFYTTNVDGF
jgi:hypothetical protein